MAGKKMFYSGIQLLIMLAVTSDCTPQPGNSNTQTRVDRNPAVAGKFYPGNKIELADTLTALFFRAESLQTKKNVLAVIAPHAGYVFSGEIAASAFNQVQKKQYKNIFVIGSSHRMFLEGASIYTLGDFKTPLGIATVDCELGKKLISANACFTDDVAAHMQEHSVEVQIPFLQHLLGNNLNLIPIVIGTQNSTTCNEIANGLAPYFNPDNLFVFSTDLSHYPAYRDAQLSDKKISDAVTLNSPVKFLQTINEIESEGISNLQTAMCGWTSILTLLDITSNLRGITYKVVDLRNSGDSKFGDKSQVVGYTAIIVEYDSIPGQTASIEDFLSAGEKKALLKIARQTITEYVNTGKIPEINKDELTSGLLKTNGAFVTLTENGQLRGCIGNFAPVRPLYKTIQEMAISAATKDYRFDTLRKEEIPSIKIEISVLTPMKKINSTDEISLGRDGIYIKKGSSSGTFLPQIAVETGWTKEEFLGHCARDKARIGWDGWKDAEIYIYQAIIFHEENEAYP